MNVPETQDVEITDAIQLDDQHPTIEVSNDEIPVENGPLPSKLHLRGVDDLSTNEIKSYLDQHIKPGYSFAKRDAYKHLHYLIEWINDSELNVSFICEDPKLAQWGATEAIKHLEYHTSEEDQSEPLDPLQERRCWDLLRVTDGKSAGKQVVKSDIANQYAVASGLEETKEVDEMEKPTLADPITLFVRYATELDHKVANSKEQSRYYLIHGEPGEFERQTRPKLEKGFRRSRFYEDRREDVVTGEVQPVKDNYRERDDRRRHGEVTGFWSIGKLGRPGYDMNYYREPARRSGRKERQRNRNHKEPKEQPRADEGDLFPDLLAKKQAERARDQSPSRMEQ